MSPAARLAYEVVSRRPHDRGAWTQGLVLHEGRLYEGTGLIGRTRISEMDPWSGEVLRQAEPPDEVFGEGIAIVGDRLIQLTWRQGIAYAWHLPSFKLLGRWRYEGEGWGLCFDGQRLVMSDGTPRLTFRDPRTFTLLGTVEVTLEGEPLSRLNELECVDGRVWANVWLTDRIVRIDPASGVVDGMIEAPDLLDPHPARHDRGAVLNGIAADTTAGTLLLTGKRWPEIVEVRIIEPSPRP